MTPRTGTHTVKNAQPMSTAHHKELPIISNNAVSIFCAYNPSFVISKHCGADLPTNDSNLPSPE